MKKERKTRAYIPWWIKQEIWNLPCCICGSRKDVYIDHIVSVSQGGSDERSNLQPLCRRCNDVKGSLLSNEETHRRRCRQRHICV